MNLLPLLATVALTASLPGADNWMVDPAAARAIRADSLRNNPAAFAPVTDDPALSRVLLIGDSISIGYTPAVRELLRGVANVHRIPDNGGATSLALLMLDEWLGDGHWDAIHFNFGLHDVTRVPPDTVRTLPDVYAENLRRIVARLQKTGAQLIFATTTPVPGHTQNPTREAADVIEFNRRAVALMTELGVPVDDLYANAKPRLAEFQVPSNVHFTGEGYRALAKPVATAIRQALTRPQIQK